MSKTFRSYAPDQTFLLAPNPAEWLPEDHLVFYLRDVIDALDLAPFYEPYEREARGAPPYDPALLCKILVYGYATGVRTSRRLERACQVDVALRILVANNFPDHTTISEFRRRNLPHFEHVLQEVLRLCQREGILKLGVVAIDGTKMKANASRDRTLKPEHIDRLIKDEVKRILDEAERLDNEDDLKYGPQNRGDELPAHLRTRQGRLDRLKEAKRQMDEEDALREKEYQEKIASRKQYETTTGKKSPGPAPKPPQEHTRQPHHERNTTDPDSRIMHTRQGSIQGYNAQAAADHHTGLLVAAYVTPQANDRQELRRQLNEIQKNTHQFPETCLADTGYWAHEEIVHAPDQVEFFIRPKASEKTGRRADPAKHAIRERMEDKLSTPRGRAYYTLRKQIIEPAFGTLKETLGIRNFLLRGHQKVDGEWKLIAASYNIKKMWHRSHN